MNSSWINSSHKAHNYLVEPPHRLSVALIGCGGTGSQVLSILARMHISLLALGHEGFNVTAYDGDTVSEANYGRQLFAKTDIDQNKAIVSVTRINRAYQLDWQAKAEYFQHAHHNIIISCVDSIEQRRIIFKSIRKNKSERTNNESRCLYWLDFGNGYDTGQVILGSFGTEHDLKHFFQIYPQLFKRDLPDTENEESCSLAQALNKQDLLINPIIANTGMALLWRLFRYGQTEYNGVIVNLKSFETTFLPFKEKLQLKHETGTATAKKISH